MQGVEDNRDVPEWSARACYKDGYFGSIFSRRFSPICRSLTYTSI